MDTDESASYGVHIGVHIWECRSEFYEWAHWIATPSPRSAHMLVQHFTIQLILTCRSVCQPCTKCCSLICASPWTNGNWVGRKLGGLFQINFHPFLTSTLVPRIKVQKFLLCISKNEKFQWYNSQQHFIMKFLMTNGRIFSRFSRVLEHRWFIDLWSVEKCNNWDNCLVKHEQSFEISF